MGRAIDMEKDIDVLKAKVEKLENTVRGMTHKLDEAAIPLTIRGEKFNKDGAKIDPNSKETTVTHFHIFFLLRLVFLLLILQWLSI